VKPHR